MDHVVPKLWFSWWRGISDTLFRDADLWPLSFPLAVTLKNKGLLMDLYLHIPDFQRSCTADRILKITMNWWDVSKSLEKQTWEQTELTTQCNKCYCWDKCGRNSLLCIYLAIHPERERAMHFEFHLKIIVMKSLFIGTHRCAHIRTP